MFGSKLSKPDSLTQGASCPAGPCAQATQSETWVCDQCQKAFPSKRALATHSGRAHGYRRLVKFYAIDQTCNACAKTYATRKRLIEHLRDAKDCLQTLQACFPPLSDEQVVAFDTVDHETTLALRAQGWGAAKALAPVAKSWARACLRQGRRKLHICTSSGASAIR